MASIITAHAWNTYQDQYFVSIGTNCKHVSIYSSSVSSKNSEVKELNLKSFMNDVTCIDYSKKRFGLVAASNKNPNLFDITNPEVEPITLKSNHSRVSTCLSFSPKSDALAVGLEKLKNHHGIHVYENPLQSRNYRSYLNNDNIHSLKFIPYSPSSILVGTSNGLKEVDLRASSKSTIYSIPTQYSHYIEVGPFTDFYFSSVSNDKSGNIAIWDRRYLSKSSYFSKNASMRFNNHNTNNNSNEDSVVRSGTGGISNPVMELENIFGDDSYSKKNVVPCYRFSPWSYNELTSLHRPAKASLLKRWNFGYEVSEVHDSYPVPKSGNPTFLDSDKEDVNNIESLFVSKVKDINDIGRVVSFDHCKGVNDGYYGSVVVLKLSGNVSKIPLIDGDTALEFNNYNSVVVAYGNEILFEEAGAGNKVVSRTTTTGESQTFDLDPKLYSRDTPEVIKEDPEEEGGDVEENKSSEMATVGNNEEDNDEEEASDLNSGDELQVDDVKSFFKDQIKPFNNFKPSYEVLQDDIASVMYKRALNNYNLTDLYHNSELFSQFNKNFMIDDSYLNSNYEQLRICWKWLYHSRENCRKLLTVQNGLDISFEGIYNVWDGTSEIIKDETRRINYNLFLNSTKTRRPESAFLLTLRQIIKSIYKPGNAYVSTIIAKTAKREQREYCLFSCGWFITQEEFDSKIKKLISLKYYEKAAGLCVFQGDVYRAIEILSSAPEDHQSSMQGTLDLRIIAAAMMGFYNRNIGQNIEDESSVINYDINSPVIPGEPLWKEQCRKLSRTLPSPHLRAIFAYLTERNWQDVLEEPSLALKEKLLIALKFLPDEKVTEYLKNITKEAIKTGNPEGIMLTGLTRKGITLLQAYNDRYTDIQTVSLISAFAVPRFFDDVRANNWINSYCELLNSWKLFNIRAKFDIARRKLSKNYLHLTGKALTNNTLNINGSHFNNNGPDLYIDEAGTVRTVAQPESATLFSGSSLNWPTNLQKYSMNATDLSSAFFLKKKDRQLYLKCIQCDRDISHLLYNKKQHGLHHRHHGKNKNLGHGDAGNGIGGGVGQGGVTGGLVPGVGVQSGKKISKDKSTVTCVCGASLPKCSICLYSLGAPIRYNTNPKVKTEDFFRDWVSFCLNCNHGTHAKHADEWFEDHSVCPVPDCNCHCVINNIS